MSENNSFQIMKCKICGAELKVDDPTKPIECVCCTSINIPVSLNDNSTQTQVNTVSDNTILRIQGQKNPASALAYVENLFEDYDWHSFCYSETLSIPEIDDAINEYKIVSADDVNTWKLDFEVLYTPFVKKVECRNEILKDVVDSYKVEDLSCYSAFDSYKRLVEKAKRSIKFVAISLEKCLEKIEKYGATEEEISEYKEKVSYVRNLTINEVYKSIYDVPEIVQIIAERDKKIARKLAESGIDADAEYKKALNYLEAGMRNEALSVFYKLDEYKDSSNRIRELDRCSVIYPYIEIAGKFYNIRGNYLYAVEEGAIKPEPVISGLKKVVSNFGTRVYYFDMEDNLSVYDPSLGKPTKVTKMSLDMEFSQVDVKRMYFLTTGVYKKFISVDLLDGAVNIVLEDVKKIENYFSRRQGAVFICETENGHILYNFENGESLNLGDGEIDVVTCTGNHIVYTRNNGSVYNKNLYVKNFKENTDAKCIESNILRYIRTINERLFYAVGNISSSHTICIDIDGSNRREWPISMNKILFRIGEWIYFLRKIGRNVVIGKIKMNGTNLRIIASNVKEYVGFSDGYIYFINDFNSLVRVRPDGKRDVHRVCDNVQTTLSIRESGVIYKTSDDAINSNSVDSIYLYQSGTGLKKLVYNVTDVHSNNDEGVILYTNREFWKQTEEGVEYNYRLYKLDVNTLKTTLCSETKNIAQRDEGKGINKVKLGLIIVTVILFITSFACFTFEAIGFGFVYLFIAFIFVVIISAMNKKKKKSEENILK